MTNSDIARLRLFNQRIAAATFKKPSDVVEWFGAVQAQDYLGALWAVGLRMRKAVEADIEGALAEKTIVRTWPMRGTLHFVAAEDVRWMLELLTPRIVAGRARRVYEQMDLTETVFARSKELFAKILQGGKQLPRNVMYQRLEAARISTADGRGLHILSRLAQDGFLCFGAREGKQQTFALLAEWAPTAKSLERDAALAELARRYFTSHGPATLQDFAWWSGLATADARAGLEMIKPQLRQETIDGQSYWLSPSATAVKETSSLIARLLPVYDEYTVAYKDRSAVLDPSHASQASYGIFNSTILVDGRIVGNWKRTLKKDRVFIETSLLVKLGKTEMCALAEAANRYGEFLGMPVTLP